MWADLIRYITRSPKARSGLTTAQKQEALKGLAKKRQQTDPTELFGKQYYPWEILPEASTNATITYRLGQNPPKT